MSIDANKAPCTMHADYVKARQRIEKLFENKTIMNLVSAAKNSDEILL